MLAFVDSSGVPHPHDPNATWAVAAVCIPTESSRKIAAIIHGLKMKHIGAPHSGAPTMELKAHRLLSRSRFNQAKHGHLKAVRNLNLLGAVFDTIESLPELSIYAVVGRRPDMVPEGSPGYLSIPYRYLLQRIHRHAWEVNQDKMVFMIFDEGEPYRDGDLSVAFTNFLFHAPEGQAMKNILETGLFVSSAVTPGIQLADLVAGALRHELELRDAKKIPGFTSDLFEATVGKYAAIVHAKTRDFEAGFTTLYGIVRLARSFTWPSPKKEVEEPDE